MVDWVHCHFEQGGVTSATLPKANCVDHAIAVKKVVAGDRGEEPKWTRYLILWSHGGDFQREGFSRVRERRERIEGNIGGFSP